MIALRLAVLVALVLLAARLGYAVRHWLDFEVNSSNKATVLWAVGLGLLVYVVLTALPFVPGAEIGVSLLGMFGAAVAPFVYGATVVSLMLAFTAGRLIPSDKTTAALRRVRLNRAADLIAGVSALPVAERMPFLMAQVDNPAVRLLARYRYVMIALAVNLPGNMVFGGGGGLALVAGLCGVFAPIPFLLTVMIAVAPVPIAVLIWGG